MVRFFTAFDDCFQDDVGGFKAEVIPLYDLIRSLYYPVKPDLPTIMSIEYQRDLRKTVDEIREAGFKLSRIRFFPKMVRFLQDVLGLPKE